MGMVGEAGFQQVNRQDFAGWSFTGKPSQYALVGQPGWVNGAGLLQPHPDYFTVRTHVYRSCAPTCLCISRSLALTLFLLR